MTWAREMWAPKGWEKPGISSSDPYRRVFSENASEWREPVRVLVTEIPEGMPEFEVGDRVQDRDDEATVTHLPVCIEGQWMVPVLFVKVDNERGQIVQHQLWYALRLTKLPREISLTIRVTGPEDAVNEVVAQVERHPKRAFDVRVEVTNAD